MTDVSPHHRIPRNNGTMRPAVSDLDRRPVVAIWEVTRACDLRCLHCRASAMPCADPGELTTAQALDVVEQLRELAPGVLVLTGGDPLKRTDLFTIIECAVAQGLAVAITPSVTPLLTPAVIARLAAVGVSRIALSLDGPDAATHDGLRGVAGSFRATLDAIAAVRSVGLPLQINTSLTAGTLLALPATGHLVEALAPALWSVFFVVPVGRASLAHQLTPEACETVFHHLCDWTERTGLAVKTTAAPAFRRVVRERERRARVRDGTAADIARRPRPLAVNDGKGFVFVSHTGEVYPSGFLPLRVGNVRHERLAAIYRESPILRALRVDSLLGGKCGRCPFVHVCGGSRARAWAVTGDMLAQDPACVYQPPPRVDARALALEDGLTT
jgi:radical SAM protein